ncbi:probable inactive receptor kinase At1g48480 [Impatiens glandulifera]|uniref:probable inactive receptor kinase At1g48480 n=1 Tax=Impatiens glandulifera TaxID=253017 RepID=UPI001FB0C3CA|nr:probable inactive receptor kinase At1g48480 [Impatiens glandulifera]
MPEMEESLYSKKTHLAMLLCIALLFLSLPAGKPDLSGDREALLTLRSAVGGRTYSWNSSLSSPCKWSGVTCENNRVTALRLPAFSLAGKIPDGTFGNLTQLRTLSLRFNALSGSLPTDLAACTELRNLYLQDNRFSGELPDSLFGLHRLIRLNLAGNEISGEISSGFNNLTRLRTLYLDRNQFSGSIPDLSFPNIGQFNVSYNQLNGSIPETLKAMPANAFTGNSLCGSPLDSCPGDNGPSSPINIKPSNVNKKKNLPGGAIAGIVIGSVLGFLFILLILCILCRKKKGRKSSSVEVAAIKHLDNEISEEKPIVGADINGRGNNGYSVSSTVAPAATMTPKSETGGAKKLVFFGNSARVFDLEDLLRASAEVLGKGMSGTTYKAVMEMGVAVVVKRLKDVIVSEKEFKEKIELVGAMIHQNLVPLKAYYFSRDEKLLVFDYMSMGSLSALLHGNRGGGRPPVNWETRIKIAIGAARGIEYIHSQSPTASHGNIRASNILLTNTHEAHISDFGLSQLVGPSTNPSRAAGYRAPEVTDSRKVSQKADVYSFGVLLLELLTGKAPMHALMNEEGVDLPRWVQSVVREEWTNEVFDFELLRFQNVEEEMVQLLQMGIDCADQYPDRRPTMADVRRRIEAMSRKEDLDSNNINEDED